MDDTQNNGMNPQPPSDGMQPAPQPQDMNAVPSVPNMSSMADMAGMTPPPAPMSSDPASVQPQPQPAPVMSMPEPAPVMPAMDNSFNAPVPSSPMQDMGTMSQPVMANTNTMTAPVGMPAQKPAESDEYAYAEDLLDEILDSLDRIEAKVEAIEKKMGQ